MNIIEFENISMKYKNKKIINNISATLEKNKIICLNGANGAGKTTLLKMILSFIHPSSGKIIFCEKLDRKDIGYSSQKLSIYEELTVMENLNFFARLYGISMKKDKLIELLSEFGLDKYQNVLANHLSGGYRQRLSICCAIVHKPKLLILDEPTAGVDPISRKEIWDKINVLKNNGMSIILTTHYIDEVSLSDIVLYLYKGKIILKIEHKEFADLEGNKLIDVFYNAIEEFEKNA